MTELTTRDGPLQFYWGASYGSAIAALKRTEEPDVMLSYVTRNNKPWDSIENLFVDCGAYSAFTNHGGYQDSISEYIDYVEENDTSKFALRDVLTADDVLEETGLDVRGAQDATIAMHNKCLSLAERRGIDAQPVTAIQGGSPEEYVEHVDMHIDNGTLTSSAGIGSLTYRDVDEIEEIVIRVDDALPNHVDLHGYGVNQRALQSEIIRTVLDTADSSSWGYGQHDARLNKTERMFHVYMKKYCDYQRELLALFAPDEREAKDPDNFGTDMELAEEIWRASQYGGVSDENENGSADSETSKDDKTAQTTLRSAL